MKDSQNDESRPLTSDRGGSGSGSIFTPRSNQNQSTLKSLYSIWDELKTSTAVGAKDTIDLRQYISTPQVNKREEAKKLRQEKYGEYVMLSEVFNYKELKESPDFGLKYYQNAIYRGEVNADNQRHGRGVMVYDSGRIYEGIWDSDKRQGHGFEQHQNGNTYLGDYMNSKPDGYGEHKWAKGDYYIGTWKDGERHGKGKWMSHTGEVYEGDWVNGEAEGEGTMTWPNGDQYTGTWVHCKKHGFGKDTYGDGSSYMGYYNNNVFHGEGEFHWKDGSYYKGTYNFGLKHGHGALFKKSSIESADRWVLYEGDFSNDKKEGYGEIKWANGSIFKGHFHNNDRHGQGEMQWYNGTTFLGEWKDNKQNGWGSMRIGKEIRTGYFMNDNYIGANLSLQGQQAMGAPDKSNQSLLPSVTDTTMKRQASVSRIMPRGKKFVGVDKPWLRPFTQSLQRSRSQLQQHYQTPSLNLIQNKQINQIISQQLMSQQLVATMGGGTMLALPSTTNNNFDYQNQQLQLMTFDPSQLSAEDVGQIINSLQEEIKIIKLQLENLPGYSQGEVPPHLHKMQTELEKIYASLEKKNDLLMQAMMKNFGKTQQDLPNFKLPEIQQQTAKKMSLFEMQTQPSPMDGPQQPKGTGILKAKQSGRHSYTAKRSLGGMFKSKKWKHLKSMEGADDPPPITEDDINKGMINLLNKGIIPRDVDLTPAFEKGAAPVMCRGIKFYDKREANVKREIQTGPTQNQLKFDLQPLPQISKSRLLVPLFQDRQLQPNIQTLKFQSQTLALPAPGDELRTQNNFVSSQGFSSQNGEIPEHLRSYNELMDVYSLHQFIIRKGKVLDQTPEFISFKRTYIHKWGSISYIIHLLEKLLSTYNVDMAYVEGKQIAMLAEEDLKKPSNDLLFDCIVNKEEVGKIIKIPSRMFKGPKGPELAAITIQKNWRMYKAHTAYTQLKFLMGKATVIQRRFRLYQFQKQTKAKVEELNNESLFVWKEMMEEFKSRWPEIKKKRRVEIHINSISVHEMKRISMEKFLQRENAQISRIFTVKDPLVDVIYIAPFQMTNDVIGYYMKILEIGEIENAQSRVTIIVPENIHKFPHHFSMAQVLTYSPKTVKRIKNLIKGKQAYIVPGTPSTDDVKLSISLQVPILCGEPSKQNLYSTKSGAKKIFQLADVPTPISAIDIYDEQEFMLQLAKLIANNLYVNTWIFKIDDEFNARGHAYLYVDNIKPLSDVRRKQVEINEDLVDKIIGILGKHLSKKVKLAMSRLYNGWSEYLEAFCRVGGVIEAAPTCMTNQMGSPSISFVVEPDGEITLVGSMDRFAAREYVNAGCMFPQQSLPNMNMMTISKSIGEILYEKGILGHVTVDLVSFPDPTSPNSHPLFWAIDLNCGMTDYASACYFFDFLMEGKLDQFTGKYFIENAQDSISQGSRQSNSKILRQNNTMSKDLMSQRSFMYCKYLHHPGLASIQYKTFFHMCRLESISFDLERRQGATFMLQDCLQSGVIAMMTIAIDRKDTLQMMVDAFKFLEHQAGNAGVMAKQKNTMDESRTDEVNVADVISAVRLLYKATLKKEEKEKIKRARK